MRHASLLSIALLAVGTLPWCPRSSWGFVGSTRRPARRSRASGPRPRSARLAFGEDPCTVLGLEPGTTDEAEVRQAVRRLAKLYHPDVPITGDVDRFQAVQQAAQQLLELDPALGLSSSPLERVYNWAGSQQAPSQGARQVASSAARPLEQAAFASSRGTRVNVPECAQRRRKDLRKTPKLTSLTYQATPETLARVQGVLARSLGAPPEAVSPDMPLEQLGFFLEGQGSIGMQHVADTAMALEEEFGIELLTILVNTWIKLPMPEDVRTVQDLADYVESKAWA